jgi:hypothetical protein
MAVPNARPINGMMVTHFSFGSFLANQGFSTSPFRTLLEWKYLDGIGRTAEEEPSDDAGLELSGDAKGFGPGAGVISSPKGWPGLAELPELPLLSGVPGRIGVVAVVDMPEVALPR